MGVPRALQLEVYAALVEYLASRPAWSPRSSKQVRLRADALDDLQRADQWLGLPDAPKGHEYDRAQVELGLIKRQKVIEAWEKSDNAQRLLVGK